MTLNAEFIQKMKESLEEEKRRIESELSRFAKPTGTSGDYETGFEDIGRDRDENAQEVENYQENLAMEDTLEKRLHMILRSLAQIAEGKYGKCASCGADIEGARLEANPEAITCISCSRKAA